MIFSLNKGNKQCLTCHAMPKLYYTPSVVVPSLNSKFVKMQQTCSALLVRARALHFATSVVVLSDIELADQGGRGCPESVGSWIIPSTEVTHTLGKGGGGENIGDRLFLACFVILF